jgi:photosystem II stability/assembly factor-like uncharacterized protein
VNDISALAVDPRTPTTLYAGMRNGGVFKSTDGGASWRAANGRLTNHFVHVLAVAPTTPTTLYAGTHGGGVYKTTDGGGLWRSERSPWPTFVHALALDPTTPTTLYAGAYRSDGGAQGGIFKSTDGGTSWRSTWRAYGVNCTVLAIDPRTPTTVYAVIDIWHRSLHPTDDVGLFKSADGGASWTAMNTGWPIEFPSGRHVNALAVDPTTPTTLYAGTHGVGVLKSTNGGRSWTATAAPVPGSPFWGGEYGRYVTVLAVVPTTPTTLYAGTHGGVFKSTDGGASWAAMNTGLPHGAYVTALALDPTTPTTLYAGAYGGVFKSTDGGRNWTAMNTGLLSPLSITALAVDPRTPTTLYAGTHGGVFEGWSGGSRWQAINSGLDTSDFTALAVDPTTSTIYAGKGRDGIYRHVYKRTGGLGTWTAMNTGLPHGAYVTALALDPTTPTTLYAGTSHGEVYKSTNAGQSWTAMNTGLPYATEVYALAVDPRTPTTLYAGKGGARGRPIGSSGVFKSTNGGTSWTAMNTGLHIQEDVHALAVDPRTPTTLYAGTLASGVFKSTNGGASWTAVNTGLTHPGDYGPYSSPVHALALDPTTPTTLYTGTSRGEVYKSTNGGASWTAMNAGLPPGAEVTALVLDPHRSTTIYAGTSQGVFTFEALLIPGIREPERFPLCPPGDPRPGCPGGFVPPRK